MQQNTFKMIRYKTDRVWFSRLLQNLARKRNGSILTTQEPARGAYQGRTFWSTGAILAGFPSCHHQRLTWLDVSKSVTIEHIHV